MLKVEKRFRERGCARATSRILLQRRGDDVVDGSTHPRKARGEPRWRRAQRVSCELRRIRASKGERAREHFVEHHRGSVQVGAFRDGLPPSVEPSTEPRSERSRLGVAVPIALGALAVVSASFGVGFLVDSNVKANRARDFNKRYSGGACNATTEACQSYDLKSDAASRSRTVSTVAFIGAGALAAGAIATFLFWPKGSERRVGTGSTPSLRVIPLVGSTIGMQGIF